MNNITTVSSDPVVRFAESELRDYLGRLASSPLACEVVLGTAEDLRGMDWAPRETLARIESLGPEGFAVEKIGERLLIGAARPSGVLYGVYDFLEALGCYFRSTGDILPAKKDTLNLPDLSYRRNPLVSRRGYLTHQCYPQLGLHSVADTKAMIDQMTRMKLNTLIWLTWPSEPWLWYEYNGEGPLFGDVSPIETGSMFWRFIGFHCNTREMPVGGDKFPHPCLAAPEFQGCATSRELHEAGREYLSEIIAHAHRRNIQVWYCFDCTTMVPNHGRFARLRPPKPFQEVCGSLGLPNDPVLREINESRFRALVETYPDLDGCFVWLTEDYYNDPTPENQALYERERPRYEEVVPAFQKHWRRISELSRDEAGEHIASAIQFDIGNVEVIKDWMRLRGEIKPDLPVGILSIGKGYLLPLLHKIFPEEVAFADLESSGVWTPNGVPMDLLGNMGSRERTIVPRIDDDGSVVGLQFVATEFAKDRVIDGCVEHGASGFLAQQYRLRGSEHNSRFLADAAWDASLDVPTFYRRYAERIFGSKAAGEVADAFLILEENDAVLGWRGQRSLNYDCLATPEVFTIRKFAQQTNPYDGPPYEDTTPFVDRKAIFEGVSDRIEKARGLLERARPTVEPHGMCELEYLISRGDVYDLLARSIVLINESFIACREAFDARGSDYGKFQQMLDGASEKARLAYETAIKTAEAQAEGIDHPSELGVLAYLNCGLVTRWDAYHKHMRNLVEFHHGRPYWDLPDWGSVFPRHLNENAKPVG